MLVALSLDVALESYAQFRSVSIVWRLDQLDSPNVTGNGSGPILASLADET